MGSRFAGPHPTSSWLRCANPRDGHPWDGDSHPLNTLESPRISRIPRTGCMTIPQVYFVSDTLIGDTTWCFFLSQPLVIHALGFWTQTDSGYHRVWLAVASERHNTLPINPPEIPMFFQRNFPLNPPVFQHFSMGFPSHPGRSLASWRASGISWGAPWRLRVRPRLFSKLTIDWFGTKHDKIHQSS